VWHYIVARNKCRVCDRVAYLQNILKYVHKKFFKTVKYEFCTNSFLRFSDKIFQLIPLKSVFLILNFLKLWLHKSYKKIRLKWFCEYATKAPFFITECVGFSRPIKGLVAFKNNKSIYLACQACALSKTCSIKLSLGQLAPQSSKLV